MYGKLFASLYQGTLRGRSNEILVFTNLIACCDKRGYVDKHWNAIADEVGITVDEVKEAISNLESPDPESRSIEEDGRRLVPMDDHRRWGWKIVNYEKYRAIRNAEDRGEQNREAQERYRKKKKESEALEPNQKEVSEVELPFKSETFKETWSNWVQHRKEKKAKLTPMAEKQCLKKIEAMGEARAIEAINHSMANGWQGLFEPKESLNGRNYGSNGIEKRSKHSGTQEEISVPIRVFGNVE